MCSGCGEAVVRGVCLNTEWSRLRKKMVLWMSGCWDEVLDGIVV